MPPVNLPNFALVAYPGVQSYQSFSFHDQSGVQPARGTLKMFPQYGIPDENGDLTITYNGTTVTIPNMHIDWATYERNSGGQTVSVQLIDERWTWKNKFISGRYNFRLPNNWPDPLHEKTPQELATLLFEAIGVQNFDVNDMPADLNLRPEVNWDRSNPAQELEKLCSGLGCMIVPIRSTQTWKICVVGQGVTGLPENYPFEAFGAGIDPKETPDFLRIVTAPIRYQIELPLGARGRDFNLAYKSLDSLSYTPQSENPPGYGFQDYLSFQDLDDAMVTWPNGVQATGAQRYLLGDGSRISACELAEDSVYRTFALDFEGKENCTQFDPPEQGQPAEWGIEIPMVDNPVSVRQIILSDKLVNTWTDFLGAQHQRPAYVHGAFYGLKADYASCNYPFYTRIDKQFNVSNQHEDERASFSLSIDNLDNYRSLVTTSQKMVFLYKAASNIQMDYFAPAYLRLVCAVNVRDPDTWVPFRYEYLFQIGSGSDENFCRIVQQDDIQPWVIGDYLVDNDSNTATLRDSTNNFDEVKQECLEYAQSIAREYQTTFTQTRTYIGIFPIDMDGQIQQVSYECGPSGHSTIASIGTEHSWVTPSWEDRRQMTAREGINQSVEYWRYEMDRREATKGSVNT